MSEAAELLRYEVTPGFVQILDTIGCTLAVSVYTANRVVLISAESGKVQIQSTIFDRPMGLAMLTVEQGTLRLALATFQDVVIFADAPLLANSVPGHPEGHFQHLLVPRATLFSGDIDAHDLAWADNGLYAANTRFSCISKIDANFSFTPVWAPPFVTALMPEDRCHLNGLAVADNRIAYATALGRSDVPRGWADQRLSGGVLLEVPSGTPVLEGLCMPHSPRVLDGDLHVLESGTGRVLRVDAGRSRTLAELPGFVRGLDRYGDILFVGLSKIRDNGYANLPIAANMDNLICGVMAVERRQGIVLGYIRFDASYEEVFDVKVLPGIRRAAMLDVDEETHHRALVLPGRAFWGEKVEGDTVDIVQVVESGAVSE